MSGETPRLTLPPSLQGSFELTRELAVGGMGVIYLARDVVNLRDVVFKFIAPELLGDEETQIRFINEARLTEKLDHPSIVKLFSAGQDGGLLYIIYEYLEGSNLKSLMEKYQIYPIGKALDILIKVAEGLACAHSHKILHRDIKPENILVAPLGDWVKIIDFGIAKSVEDSQKLTQTGFIIGTPEYLSPEQAVGHKASFYSDQYAVAVLAYEMLTGHLPIEEANTVDLFTKKIRGAWVPIRERRSEIPADLQKIIERAMATEAERRYPAMGDFVNDLKDFANRRASISARSAAEASGLYKRGRAGSADPSGAQRRGTSSSPQSSGVGKRPGTTPITDGSGAHHRGGARDGVRTQDPTIRISERAIPFFRRSATDIVRRLTQKVPPAVLAGTVVIPLVLLLLWVVWPFAAKGPALPRLTGDVTIRHQLDGVTFAWDVTETGKATIGLEPGHVKREMRRQGREYVLRLDSAAARSVERVDLMLRQGTSIEAEARGIPLVTVRFGAEAVGIDVGPLDAPAPVLAVWRKGQERAKKEMALSPRQGRFTIESLSIPPSGDTYIQVMAGSGSDKEPLSLVQRIEPPGEFAKALDDKLDALRVLELLSGKKGRVDDSAWGQPNWLDLEARKLLKESGTDALAALADAGDVLKELVVSSSLDRELQMALYEHCQELRLLLEMAKRSGYSGSQPELELFFGLPWPTKVSSQWSPVPGQPPHPDKMPRRLLETSTTQKFKASAVSRAGVKAASISFQGLVFGTGTYIKITLNRRWFFYVWGPGEIPPGTKGHKGSIEVEFPADLLAEGDNSVEIDTRPVVSLVRFESEIVVLAPSLTLYDRSRTATPVKLERVGG